MLNKTFSKTQNTAQNAKNISLAKKKKRKKAKKFSISKLEDRNCTNGKHFWFKLLKTLTWFLHLVHLCKLFFKRCKYCIDAMCVVPKYQEVIVSSINQFFLLFFFHFIVQNYSIRKHPCSGIHFARLSHDR